MNLPRLLNIRNGKKAVGTFSDAEMDRRMLGLRQFMAETGIDVALMTSFHNINYYSDFMYCAFGRHYGLVVSQEKQTTISANIDGGQPGRRAYGDNLVYTDWQKDNFFHAVKELVPVGAVIGIECDDVSVTVLEKLKAALPGSTFVDIAEATMKFRMFKSEEELAHITAMAEIADIGGKACVEAIDVGTPEYEVARHATRTMIQEIAIRFPNSEFMDTWTWLQSGINTDGAHNPVTARRIEYGDILSLNCFPMVAGYYVALERTLFAGAVSDAHLRIWEVNCRVHEEGKKLIRPGARCCDIALELNKIYRENDLLQYRTFGYGHSFGVLSHYYGREAGLELREDIETVLEPDMVISMEPMVMLPEGMPGAGGYREHDVLILTEDGNRNLTGFPYGSEHNVISLQP